MKKLLFIFLLLFLDISYVKSQVVRETTEMRGVWICTVKRLDFPSRSNLTGNELKEEIIKILDSCKKEGLNTIIFQIRPAADAFYDSPYEPWSEWLTGKQGRAPSPYFDPLKFMIEQTHKRNMTFHAWINPFRAIATIGKADIVSNHITKRKPEWFFDYGVNRYFDPGIPEVQDYIVKIIADITRRYDIDAIHFDDYFYPYPLRDKNKKIIPIPDYSTFQKYGKGFADITDWRRDNINRFIKRVHDTIKSIKPYVEFGVSPPAVWRNKGYDPKGSNTLGLASYDWLYADVLLWVKNGWLDYVAPQLYWYIGHSRADFKVLLEWWTRNCYSTKLYIGLNLDALISWSKDVHYQNPNEIPNQIKLAEEYPQVKGFILFRYKSLNSNPLGIKYRLKNEFFADTQTVVLIAMNDTNNTFFNDTVGIPMYKDTTTQPLVYPPLNVEKYRLGNEVSIVWDKNPKNSKAIKYNVYRFEKEEEIVPDFAHLYAKTETNYFRFKTEKRIMLFAKKYTFVITAIDKNGVESKMSSTLHIRMKH